MLTEPDFVPSPSRGLRGASVKFSVEQAPEEEFNQEVVAFLNEEIGEWEDPELPTPFDAPLQGRAKQLLSWVYLSCKAAEWPVFELGDFQSEGGSDLNGVYHLPTRVGPKWLPYKLFRFVLEEGLQSPRDGWNEERFAKGMRQIQKMLFSNGLKGASRRPVLLALYRRGHQLTEIADDIFKVGSGDNCRLIRGTITDKTSLLFFQIQRDKAVTALFLRSEGIPTVEHVRVFNLQQAISAANKMGYPVVLKPVNGTQGRGVTCGIRDEMQLRNAAEHEELNMQMALVEKHIEGDFCRITMTNGEVLEIRHTHKPKITGNGKSKIRDLVDKFASTGIDPSQNNNTMYKLAFSFEEFLRKNDTERVLDNQGCYLDQVLEEGREINIADRSYYKLGAILEWHQVGELNADMHDLLLKINRIFRIDAMGVDILNFKIDMSSEDHFAINEVNAGPQIDRFDHVIEAFIDKQFP